MIGYIIWYVIPGLLWTGWLEWFTTTRLEGEYSAAWSNRERIFHLLLWPFSLFKFMKEFIKGFFGGYDEE